MTTSSNTKVTMPAPRLSTTTVITALSVTACFIFTCRQAEHAGMLMRVVTVGAISFVSYILSNTFIEAMSPLFLKAGMMGKDINKRGTPAGDLPVAESLGLISAIIYIIVLCILHLFGYYNGDSRLYTAAMACVTSMTLLGFTDDVLDLKWRYKLVLPLIASLPLLVNYSGKTTVLVPRTIQPLVATVAKLGGGGDIGSVSGRLVDLGMLYYLYMALLSIFCTNAINIHAGINGLEAGQCAVIAIFVIVHNALNLNPFELKDDLDVLRAHHGFSLDMMLPLLAVTLGLLKHNWYPSRVFVGDTFCYFAGMSFAMASILGHYSSTLLLFFVPQVANFVYSIPQLFGIVHCPRHRLPRFNKQTGKLEAIKTNMNIVNLTLWIFGPMTENRLCVVLLTVQALCCVAGLLGRALYLQYMS